MPAGAGNRLAVLLADARLVVIPEGPHAIIWTHAAEVNRALLGFLRALLPAAQGCSQAQYDAVCTWGIPDHALLQRLSGLQLPVFVANGDSDPMILPHYSYLIAGLIPQARVKIYPDSAHGFLFQHHAEFAADVEAFLSAPRRYREVCLPRPAESGSQGAGQQRSDPSCGLIDEHFPRLAIPRQALRNVRRTSIFMHAARPDEAVA